MTPAHRRRSESTKAAILAAARRRFIDEGYERTTIRAIAADAHIDPAMVMRYFGSKEQLFRQVSDYDLRLPDLTAMPREEIGERVVRHLIELWETDRSLLALMRTAVADPVEAGKMRELFGTQVLRTVAALYDGDIEKAAPRAGLAATQVLGLALCRYALEFPPVVAMSVEDIVAWYGPTLQRYVAGEV